MNNRICIYNVLGSSYDTLSDRRTHQVLLVVLSRFISCILFQGHISRVYTTVDHIEGLKTLHELYNSEATLYTCPGMRDFMRNLQNPEDEIETKFFDRAHLTNDDHRGMFKN